MSTHPECPLHRASYNATLQRVVYRLIQLDYRRNPARYAHPPSGILELALSMRVHSPEIYWTLQAAARFIGSGAGTLRDFRSHRYDAQMRAMYKRRVTRPYGR